MSEITYDEITRISMLHLCRDPRNMAEALRACALDPDVVIDLLDFCKAEGIDSEPAIRLALAPGPIEKAMRGK